MYNVKLSVNAPLGNSKIIKQAGFHYIEPSNTDIMKMTPLEFRQKAAEMKAADIQCSVIDNPIPCSVDLSDPAWDLSKWYTYLALSARRAKVLGAKYWCIGNGASRMLRDVPDRVMINFYEMVDTCAEIGMDHGIDIIVEPLGPSVTDYLLNLEETAAFLAEIGRDNVFTMVDYRWEYEQGRPTDDLYRYADRIVHAHIDNPDTDYAGEKVRRVQSRKDTANYTPFMDFIKSEHFHGIVSIEANTFDDYGKDLAEAIEFYKSYDILSARE